MKILKKIIFIFMLIVPFNVYGAVIQFGCPSQVQSGEKFTCAIYVLDTCSEVSLTLDMPEELSLQNNIPSKNYKSVGTGTNFIYNGTGTNDRVLSSITILAPKVTNTLNYTITLKNIRYKYTSDEEYITENDISNNVIIKPKTTTTAKNQSLKEYTLTLDSNGGNIENQTLTCSANKGKCEVNLANAKSPSKNGYTFKGWGNNKKCTSGETDKYILSKDAKLYACFIENTNTSEMPYLSSLTIDGYNLDFNSTVYKYQISVADDVNNLDIKAKSVDNSAYIDINKPDVLVLGSNDIIITVTNRLYAVTYTITVNKGDGQTFPGNDLTLANLVFDAYDVAFDPYVYTYNVTINHNVKTLDISAVTSDSSSTYEILDNNNLKTGSIITIRVTNSAGLYADYIFNINVKTTFEQYKTYFILGIIIIFMFTVYFIVRNIKIKNGEITGKSRKKLLNIIKKFKIHKKKDTSEEVDIL